ncbi:hypothetical protein BIW11_11581 [Tropilaelaps mercedesae]|uniref:Uncharacterized protein n=1 Tax=Tropilaelaps mercedesae TaxID=418985 RepID=A0A1V9XAV0_9ACAR|nr:hypothetical protein BIW11_11581 [Tropilaelaps mercedesae]
MINRNGPSGKRKEPLLMDNSTIPTYRTSKNRRIRFIENVSGSTSPACLTTWSTN